MTFEFLIACDMATYNNIEDLREFLSDVLTQILDYTEIDFDDSMIQIRHVRPVDGIPDTDGNTLIGFVLEFPEDADDIDTVVIEFTQYLIDRPPVLHIVKFEDPLLQSELSDRAGEIFALEMKLRRVLSFIYLHAYQGGNPYDLLKEEQVQIPRNERPTEDQIKDAGENEFFHMTFSKYINLNQRRQIDPREIVGIIRDSEQYDDLREELTRSPIVNERDVDLLNNLKELMNPVEQMRNCVAHNRRPSTRIRQNYAATLPRLEELLDDYLADLTV